MRETEVKAKINDWGKVRDRLEDLGCVFLKTATQEDEIFLTSGIDFFDIDDSVNVLRIRKEEEKSQFTLKRRIKNGDELDCIEREIEISDPIEMKKILEDLGFYKVVEVKKSRTKAKLKEVGVCLDDVEGLGKFIELEKMWSETELETGVRDGLKEVLLSLGLSEDDMVFEGYDTMIMKNNKA